VNPGHLLPWILAGRVVLSVGASVIQKQALVQGTDPGGFWRRNYLWMVPAGLVGMFLDWDSVVASQPRFWWNAVVAGAIDAAGNLLMLSALRRTDLSVFGPLTAFRPVLALMFGWLFLRESPSATGLVGVAVTASGGALLFSDNRSGPTVSNGSRAVGIILRLAGLSLSTLAAVFLKTAVQSGTPGMTLGVWIASGSLAVHLAGIVRIQGPPEAAASSEPPIGSSGTHAAVFFLMQWLTLLVFRESLLAYSFAFFQAGMVLQVVVGRILFDEPAFGRRLAGCGVLGIGTLLIAWKG
jgi:drug/metabolite transporter (DMT)-like permease